ncbi:MAG: hypothetical protein Q8Q60_04870 [Candidatus Chromulinivorax sp.]|nr:hypothetical protein [Candidatus Chromulinivorax sp.]
MKKIWLLSVSYLILCAVPIFGMSSQQVQTIINRSCSNHEELILEILPGHKFKLNVHRKLQSRSPEACGSCSVQTSLPSHAYKSEEGSNELNDDYQRGLFDMVTIINKFNKYYNHHIPINKLKFYDLIQFIKKDSFQKGQSENYNKRKRELYANKLAAVFHNNQTDSSSSSLSDSADTTCDIDDENSLSVDDVGDLNNIDYELLFENVDFDIASLNSDVVEGSHIVATKKRKQSQNIEQSQNTDRRMTLRPRK